MNAKMKKILAAGVPAVCIVSVLAGLALASGDFYTEMPYTYDAEAFDASMDVNEDGIITGNELKIIKVVDAQIADEDDGGYSYYKPKLQLRAAVHYTGADSMQKLDDSRLRFDSYHWKKGDDGWYYYDSLVAPGECAEFIKGVTVPCEWDNSTAGKDFDVIVTVQAAESFLPGGPENQEVFEIRQSLLDGTLEMKGDAVSSIVKIEEYERDDHGDIHVYQNNKLVTPCQYVSKIVVFRVGNIVFRNGQIEEAPEVPVPFIANFIPKTGDDMSLVLYGAGFILFFVLFIRFIKRNRHRKEKSGNSDRKESNV